MKKILGIIITTLIAVTLTGCNGEGKSSSEIFPAASSDNTSFVNVSSAVESALPDEPTSSENSDVSEVSSVEVSSVKGRVSSAVSISNMVTSFSSSKSETSGTVTSSERVTTSAATTTSQGNDDKVLYKELINPVAPSGADPWVVKHNGKYYYCWSGGPGVRVKEIPSLDKISNDNYSQVYLAPSGTMYSAEYWAPELHYINGEWYIYVAADDGNNENHRMYVLKGTSQDPTDPFEMIGQITDPTNRWAIDGTVVIINKELYFIWSGWIADVNVMQNIYIAHMSNPWTIDSERTLISDPTKSWERIGDPKVNEGPAALYHDGKVFIVYSASGSWTDDYCLGMLTYSGGDPLNRASWTKNSEPVFSKKIGVAYGPGHCSFTTAVDGSVWMVYHANLVSGTGWSGRQVWLSPVNFADDGTPVFEDGPSTRIERFPYAILSSAE